jgi:ATP-dependent Lon protease
MDKEQREYFHTQQMKTIQKELGGSPQEKAAEELAAKSSQEKNGIKKQRNYFKKETPKNYNVPIHVLRIFRFS